MSLEDFHKLIVRGSPRKYHVSLKEMKEFFGAGGSGGDSGGDDTNEHKFFVSSTFNFSIPPITIRANTTHLEEGNTMGSNGSSSSPNNMIVHSFPENLPDTLVMRVASGEGVVKVVINNFTNSDITIEDRMYIQGATFNMNYYL